MAAMMAAAMLAAATGTAAPNGSELLGALRACHAVAATDRRLACLERAATALEAAVDRTEVTIIDRETVRRTRQSMFGFAAPALALFSSGKDGRDKDERDEVREVKGAVQSVREIAPDRIEIRLAGGAVWKNIDYFRRQPRPGDQVTIVRATLGSYFMSIGNSNAGTRCIRVQ